MQCPCCFNETLHDVVRNVLFWHNTNNTERVKLSDLLLANDFVTSVGDVKCFNVMCTHFGEKNMTVVSQVSNHTNKYVSIYVSDDHFVQISCLFNIARSPFCAKCPVVLCAGRRSTQS